MDPATGQLHLTLIRLGKGCLKAWERWVQARQKGLRPDVIQLHLTLIRGLRRGVMKPWDEWVQARLKVDGQTMRDPDAPRHLPMGSDPNGSGSHTISQ